MARARPMSLIDSARLRQTCHVNSMTIRQFRPLLNSFAAKTDGFYVAGRLIMGCSVGRIEQRILRIVRTHADGLLDMIYGPVGSTVKSERTTEKSVRGGEVWIEIQCALEFFDRVVGAPPGEGHEAEREMRTRGAVV